MSFAFIVKHQRLLCPGAHVEPLRLARTMEKVCSLRNMGVERACYSQTHSHDFKELAAWRSDAKCDARQSTWRESSSRISYG